MLRLYIASGRERSLRSEVCAYERIDLPHVDVVDPFYPFFPPNSQDYLYSFRGRFSSSEAHYRANWSEPGFGTRAYMDCIPSHSEGGAWVQYSALAKHTECYF